MRSTRLAATNGDRNADRPEWWRRLRSKLAVPAGAVAAAIALLFGPTVSAEAVSAEKICKWRHVSHWADSLDDGDSWTYGAISCLPNSGVSTACHVTIVMGPYFNFGDSVHRQWCNTRASVPVRRSAVLNYAADFRFGLQLIDRRRRWTQSFVGKSRPSDGCHTDFVGGRHTLLCTNVHPR